MLHRIAIISVAAFLASGCASTTKPGAIGVERSQLLLVSSDVINQKAAASYANTSSKARSAGNKAAYKTAENLHQPVRCGLSRDGIRGRRHGLRVDGASWLRPPRRVQRLEEDAGDGRRQWARVPEHPPEQRDARSGSKRSRSESGALVQGA